MSREDHTSYLDINRSLWNDKVATHLQSAFYDVKGFIAGKSSLNDIELGLLGDVQGQSILHLQCHFGQDTIDLSRRGAICTGLDLSDESIQAAKSLASQCGTNTRFVCGDVYSAPELIDERFDIVFTSYGTIGWLPDIQRWAAVVKTMLKPGGRFVFVEFHPVVWMMDYDFEKVAYSYFNRGPIVEDTEGTYTDGDQPPTHSSISWNHGIGEVLSALLSTGLKLKSFEEFDRSPYDCFKHTVKTEDDQYQIKGLQGKLPMVYALSMESISQ